MYFGLKEMIKHSMHSCLSGEAMEINRKPPEESGKTTENRKYATRSSGPVVNAPTLSYETTLWSDISPW